MRTNIHEKIIDRLTTRSAEMNLPPRSDMEIVDLREIDAMKCNVLIGYDAHVGAEPTLYQVERFIEATFNGRVHMQSATAKIHEVDNAVSVCLTRHTDTRPLIDTTGMRRIAGSGYFDDATGSIWHVRDNGSNKFLVRQTDDNIADIVQVSMTRSSRKQATFAKVRQAAPMLTVGDRVRFFDGTVPVVGELKSMSGNDVTISANGKSYTVARESVFNVVERSSSSVKSDKDFLRDYFTRAFGNADFGRQLTQKMTRDDDSAEDTGFSGTTGLGSK